MQSMRPSSVPRADRADDGHAGAGGGHKRLSEGDADRLTPHLHGGCRGRMTVAESFLFLRQPPLPRRQGCHGVQNPCPKSTSHNRSVRRLWTSSPTLLHGAPSSVIRPAKDPCVVDHFPIEVSDGDVNLPRPSGKGGSTHPSPRPCGDPDARRRDAKVRARIHPPPRTGTRTNRGRDEVQLDACPGLDQDLLHHRVQRSLELLGSSVGHGPLDPAPNSHQDLTSRQRRGRRTLCFQHRPCAPPTGTVIQRREGLGNDRRLQRSGG